MSLLDKIKDKKKQLTHTQTILTNSDGRKFVEIDGNCIKELPIRTYGFIVDEKPDNIPVEIIEHLYLGSQDCCELIVLKQYNITHVLSIGVEATIKQANIVYQFVHCLDLPESKLEELLNKCIPFIDEVIKNCGNILVHCNAGISRSPTVIIGYLILKKHYSFFDAFNLVKMKRNSIQPNSGFLQQLKLLA